MNASRWFYGLPGVHSFREETRSTSGGTVPKVEQQPPILAFRWRVDYPDASGQRVTAFLVTSAARDQIVRYHPLARVTDLAVRWCDPCGGSCSDMCDAGAGAWPERSARHAREYPE